MVVSILLAFWIDVTWEFSKERGQGREHMEAVRAELLENIDALEGHAATCDRVLGATRASSP